MAFLQTLVHALWIGLGVMCVLDGLRLFNASRDVEDADQADQDMEAAYSEGYGDGFSEGAEMMQRRKTKDTGPEEDSPCGQE